MSYSVPDNLETKVHAALATFGELLHFIDEFGFL
jgi:hypothetical protein